ncbi:MAG: GerMN domain-containing protein [Acidimicrobiia bacterium]|nr:GerMN domain-containing protein [Acidimicrobiia bacterium]
MKNSYASRVLWALFLVVAACGGTADPTTTTDRPGTVAPTTTTAPQSTTTVPSTTTTQPAETLSVYFSFGDGSDCSEVKGYQRTYQTGLDPIILAFDLLVAGPTGEEIADGAGSFFSADTADVVRSVNLDGDGVLSVDFEDIRLRLNNASTSCGSSSLLSQLTSTALQFEEVARARFSINGNCSVFFNWLQRECMELTRDGAIPAGSTEDLASRSGCTPGTGELPDGEWFGFVNDVTEDAVIFDLACWFTGTAAEQAAAEDGEESPPPNDYYVRNVNATLRTVPVAAGAEVNWLPDTGDPTTATTVDFMTWLAQRDSRLFQPGIWLTVADGSVTFVEEQFVP